LTCPCAIVFVLALFIPKLETWLPSFAMMQCGEYDSVDQYENILAVTVICYINYEFLLLLVFILCVYRLRHIRDEFNINTELRAVTTILFFSDMFYIGSIIFLYDTVFDVLGFVEYIEVVLSITLLCLTSITPVVRTYYPSGVVPFPISQEVIEHVDSAMIMPIASQMFYEFLNDLSDIRGMTLIAMYSDLRRYSNMISDHAPAEEIKKQAMTVYKDYIIKGNTYEMDSNEIIDDLREGYNGKTKEIEYDIDEVLFTDLFDFCIGGLEVYYEIFKKSDRFTELRNEVDRQEVLYHVLKKYNLISN